MLRSMGDLHDHDPSAFDDLLGHAEVNVTEGSSDVSATVMVAVDAECLDGLVDRARREGRDIEQVVADALRAAA